MRLAQSRNKTQTKQSKDTICARGGAKQTNSTPLTHPPMSIVSTLIVVVTVVAVFIQYRLSSTGVSPVVSVLPPLPTFPSNEGILTGKVQRIGIGDLVGPESLVTATHNGAAYMFAGLGDGRIVRLSEDGNHDDLSWTTVMRTGEDDAKCGKGGPADTTNTEEICGRPLGMKIVKRSSIDNTDYDEDGDVLVVADAYKGLLDIWHLHRERKWRQNAYPRNSCRDRCQ